MNYYQWSGEYLQQEVNLNKRISELKAERKALRSSKERRTLEDRIYTLYGMYLECMHVRQVLEGRAKRIEDTQAREF